ncbi:hypothetical protein RQP46_009919 [Phenoliferia psychrophenolica]
MHLNDLVYLRASTRFLKIEEAEQAFLTLTIKTKLKPKLTPAAGKALCIGIEYKDHHQLRHLPGCHNDAMICFAILGILWLVEGAKPNDSLFFHFSGHGGQVADKDGDEPDGLDEWMISYMH